PCREQLARLPPLGLARLVIRVKDATACTHKPRLSGNRWLPQTTCAGCAFRRSSAAVATNREVVANRQVPRVRMLARCALYQGNNGPGSGELCQPTRPPVLVTTPSATWVGGKA